MPSEFKAVEAYLSHLESIHFKPKMLFNSTPVSDSNADQKVPQLSVFNLSEDDMMFNDIKMEPSDVDMYYKFQEPFSFSEDVKLLPVTVSNCTPVEMNDQQLTTDQSPIHLLDLDHANNDVTFYNDSFPSMPIKQELSAVPSGCTDYGFDTQSQESFMFGVDQNQSESMEAFLINQVKKEIDAACNTLNISSDPIHWSIDQTRNWVLWTLQQYQLPTEDGCMFQMPGSLLCVMTEADFLSRSSDCGSTLYSQLEIWKNACNLYQQGLSLEQSKPFTGSESTFMSYPEYRVVTQPTPSVSPAPSSSSQDSYNSSSGSSIGFPVTNSLQFDVLHEAIERETVPAKTTRHEHKQTIHLWQFLKELLVNASSHANCIKWLDREKGIFKIEDSARVARLWGKRKNRPAMNYDKLSRSIRQYYKKGIIKKTEHSKRLVYQFCKPYLS